MLAAVPITAVLAGGGADLGADAIVIPLRSFVEHQVRARLVPGALAALMVDEQPHVGGFAAGASRRRQHAMRAIELDDDEASRPPDASGLERRQHFPLHTAPFHATWPRSF